jgi:hypothetical protein
LKLNENHLRGLMLGCGVLLLGMGVAKGLLGLNLDEKLEHWLSNGLFFAAAIAFLQLSRLRRQRRNAEKKP